MKIKTFFLTLLLLISSVSIVKAEEAGSGSAAENKLQEQRVNKSQRQEELQQKRTEAQEKITQKKEEVEGRKEQKREQRNIKCEQTQEKIQNRLNNYETKKDKWTSRYNGVISRIESLTGKLEEKGCDMSQIRSDMTEFEGLVGEFAAKFRVFNGELSGSKAYACGESQGQFREQLQQSRSSLTQAKQAGSDLHSFMQDTLKPNLKQAGDACQLQLQNNGGGEQ